MPIVMLKNPEAAVRHSPTEALADIRFVEMALLQAFSEGDAKAFKEIFRAHLDSVNVSKALENADISERTFYHAVSPAGNPNMDTLFRMMRVIRRPTNSKEKAINPYTGNAMPEEKPKKKAKIHAKMLKQAVIARTKSHR